VSRVGGVSDFVPAIFSAMSALFEKFAATVSAGVAGTTRPATIWLPSGAVSPEAASAGLSLTVPRS
jgi:hypothetical protein